MDTARRETIREMIRVKERYERNLETMLNTLPENDELKKQFIANCVPTIDYESQLADAFLGRINTKIHSFLHPRGANIDKGRLQKLRKSDPSIDALFKELDYPFFQPFAQGEKSLIHGDAAQDNFGSIRGEIYLGDREIHYIQGNPQYSLWYLLGTAIPDPIERRREISSVFKNDFLELAFEERYGPITEENRRSFQDYQKIYDRMDIFQSIIGIARALRGVKGQDMLRSQKMYDHVRSSHILDMTTLDLVLQKYIDLGDDEKTQQARAILFPELTTEETLSLEHCYTMMRREKRRENFKSKWKGFSKRIIGAGLLSAILGATYTIGQKNSEFEYEKGHEATRDEPYVYARDAPFTIKAIYFDGQPLDEKIMSMYSGNFFVEAVPYINPGSDSHLGLYYEGKIAGQHIDIYYGENRIYSRDFDDLEVDRRARGQIYIPITWPCDISPAIELNVTLTSSKDPSSDPSFSASYYAFTDPVGKPLHKGYMGTTKCKDENHEQN